MIHERLKVMIQTFKQDHSSKYIVDKEQKQQQN